MGMGIYWRIDRQADQRVKRVCKDLRESLQRNRELLYEVATQVGPMIFETFIF